MPRVRPLRTKEEIDAVPIDEPVTIEMEPEGTVILDKEADDKEREAREVKEPVQRERKKKQEEPAEDEEKVSLRKQLEDMRKAAEEREQAHQRRLQEAEERARQQENRYLARNAEAQDAEYQAILNAIGAAESEAEAAQNDIARASEASDAKTVADASRRLARAESRLAQLEDGKMALEAQKSREARQAKEFAERPPAPPQQQTPEQFIDQMPNLMPSQRDWLKQHQELITNTNKNLRLQGAHAEAIDLQLQPGTQKYFDHLEMRLGYKRPEEEEEDERAVTMSAPPSRQATNPSTGRAEVPNRITLDPEQREMARLSGISELEYARGLQRLAEAKAKGNYQ
jgi:hypothetical protein